MKTLEDLSTEFESERMQPYAEYEDSDTASSYSDCPEGHLLACAAPATRTA